MIRKVIQTLYQYSAWTNGRALNTVAHLSPTQFVASRGASLGSARDTLVHMVGSQWLYLERWQGRSLREMLIPSSFSIFYRPAGTRLTLERSILLAVTA
jgi:uncharacterized damage-inducible protein DinB